MMSPAAPSEGRRFSPEAMERRILCELGRALDIEPDEIDPHAPFERLGLSSALALELLTRLSRVLERDGEPADGGDRLDPSTLWRCPTPHRLARHLSQKLAQQSEERGGGTLAAGRERKPRRPASFSGGAFGAGEQGAAPEPVAVVGLACRFPGGPDARSFWRLLSDGREALRDVPLDRWDGAALHDPDRSAPGRIVTRRGYFLDRIDGFDAPFFHISPREARAMDPQQRLLLEVVWEAAEAAGLDPEALEGTAAGVFVGALWSDYAALMVRSGPEAVGPHTATGLASSILSNRVSYTLGLRGPSLTVDTACSSSLVAVHLACQSLALGDAELAFAGGVGIMSAADGMLMASKFGGLAPDGRSKAFAASADGYGRGEGAGIVVLKPLSRALADGDPVHALIRGTAVTNDGASNGLTAPNPEAQVEVLRRAYDRARVEPASVDYVETHGTGTLLGDPIEASALGEVLGEGRPEDQPLRIGSVKTNIGHLEGAAGVAGLIKVVLSLAERELPPSLHFDTPNPHIPFDRLGIELNATARPWPRPAEPGLAGVSSFGFGGTNCHLVIEGWTARHRGVLPLVASGRDELGRLAAQAAEGLRRREATAAGLVAEWAERIAGRSDGDRAGGETRMAIPFQGRLDLAARLEALAAGEAEDGLSATPEARAPVVFVFPGHGSQWAGMGMRLYQREPVYRRTLDGIEELFRDLAGWSLLEEMWTLGEGSRIESAEVSIPSLFATQVALGRLWRSWGVAPDAYLGHSHGEIAAAHLGGALGLDDGVRLVYHLGQLYARIFAYGSMLVVPLAPERARELVVGREGEVGVAVHHMPEATVLSGRPETLRQIASELDAQGLRSVVPRVHAAPHSPLVEPLMADLAERMDDLVPAAGLDTPLVSTLTGDFVAAADLDAGHWVAAMRRPALFVEAVERFAGLGDVLYLELSAHPILGRAIAEISKRQGRPARVLGSMRAGADGGACLRETAAGLFLLGHDLDWRAVAGVEEPSEPVLVTLSARDEGALRDAAVRWKGLAESPAGQEVALADLAYTSTVRRSHLGHRLAVEASGRQELAERLGRFAAGEMPRGVAVGQVRAAGSGAAKGPVFLFSGQGSQWPGMGRVLLREEPRFREVVEECDRIFRRMAGESLLPLLEVGRGDERDETTRAVQPALFALQVGLATLWRSRGVEPRAVVGHSVGEVAAATVAGALSLEQGLTVIDHRSRLMERASGKGSMADVRLGADELRGLLEPFGGRLSVAAENAPGRTVVSGEPRALEELLDELRRRRVACRALSVDCAFHSAQMEPARRALEAALADLTPGPLAVAMVSTVTGEPVAGEELDAAYWARALREPVLFAPALERAVLDGPGRPDRLLEIGPHGSLVGYVDEILLEVGRDEVVAASMRKGRDPRESLLEAAGRLHVAGQALDFAAFHPLRRRVVETPTYAWQRERYWLERATVSGAGAWGAMAGRSEPVYELVWRDQGASDPGVEPGVAPSAPSGPGLRQGDRWLVVGAGGELSRQVARAVRRRGDEVVVENVVGEGADEPERLRRLVSEVSSRPRSASGPLRILHLVAADRASANGRPRSSEETSASPADPSAHRSLAGSLLHLLQGTAQAVDGAGVPGLPGRAEVWAVTRGATAAGASVPGDALLQAPLWGLGRTASFEHGELWGGLVDLDPETAPEPDGDREADALVSAVADAAPDRRQIAIRRGRRLVPRLVSVSPSGSPPTPGEASRPVSPDGVYLVTGGLGALGLEVAGWLVERGARHLVLVGRSAPSPAAARRIAAFEAAGAGVTVAQADVTDRRAMGGVLDALVPEEGASAEGGRLRGVIHAAGVTDDGPLAGLDWERAWRVMAVKVAGAWALHELTLDAELDFFVLFSSAAALGNGGQAPYAAGNAALDALAQYRRGLGLPAVSMAWGPWTTGLAAESGNGTAPRRWADLGIRPFEPRHALGLLERFRREAPPHLVLFDTDWALFSRAPHVARTWGPLVAEIHGPAVAGGASDGAAGAAGTDDLRPAKPTSQEEMVAYLQRVAAQILGAPGSIPTDRDFQELGVDSLMVGEVVSRLRRDLELPVFPRELFDHPTIDTLASHLWRELGEVDGAAHATGEPESVGPFQLRRWASAPPAPAAPERCGPGAALLVSSPRSGSTLLRVMLAGHPALFSPPELHLLGFESLAERREALGRTGLTEGLERALMELTGEPLEPVRERLARWAEDSLPISEVYRRLDELAAGRMLVDKSPSYAADAGALQRAEAWLDAPKILHLVRHPFAVVDSFVRNRMHGLIAARGVDPYALAEEVWTSANANLLELAERLPGERYFRVSFEDLVRRPRPVLEAICRFLDVPFREEVLTPYEGERMTDGVTHRSLPVGDARFHEHEGINPERAEAWRRVELARPLGFEARRVARRLGYSLDRGGASEPSTAVVARRSPGYPGAGRPASGERRERLVTVRGLDLCLSEWGAEENPMVLCLHGFLDQGASWQPVAEQLAGAGYRVVAPDLRGHGRSSHLPAGVHYDVADSLADIEALRRYLGRSSFVLVGHSFGASLAALYAGLRPEAVERLVLVEPVSFADATAPERVSSLMAHLERRVNGRNGHNGNGGPVRLPDLATAAERMRAIHVGLPPGLAFELAQRATRAVPEGGLIWCHDPALLDPLARSFDGETFSELVARIRAPVTILQGTGSDHTSADRVWTHTIRRRASWSIVVAPGGHNLHLEASAEVASAVSGRPNAHVS